MLSLISLINILHHLGLADDCGTQGLDKRITKCVAASEKFIDAMKGFLEGLNTVGERLTEFETAAAEEEKQRKISSAAQVPGMEAKLQAAKDKHAEKLQAIKDKENEAKAAAKADDEDLEAKLEKEQV